MLMHADLFVSSMERALEFYVGGLGFAVVTEGVLEGDIVRFMSEDHYTALRAVFLLHDYQGAMLELMEFVEGSRIKFETFSPPRHAGPIAVLVKSLDQAIARLRASGVEPKSETFVIDIPKLGRSAVCFVSDPDGNSIELVEVRRQAAAS